jgi:hypothetical protein
MATGYLLPIGALFQGFSDQGVVASGYKINTYVGGSVSTPVTTYTDSTLTTPNANPLILGSNGRFQSLNVWVPSGTLVKLVMTDANNNVLTGGTIDNVPGVNDPSSVTVTQAQVGAALYPQIAAETAASVTPSNYAYPPGDIRRYGAVGDNTVDCTIAIQAAITVASQNLGPPVYIPQGTFKVISTLTVGAGKQVNIYGAGKFLSIIFATGFASDVPVINYNGSSGSRIDAIACRGFAIWSNNNLARGITATWVINSAFDDLYFYQLLNGWVGTSSFGNKFRNNNSFSITTNVYVLGLNCNNCFFEGTRASSCNGGIVANNIVDTLLIAGCDFEGITAGGAAVQLVAPTGTTISNVSILGCHFENINGTAILCSGVDANSTLGLTVKGNLITGGFAAIPNANAVNAIQLVRVNGFDISNNNITDWGTQDANAGGTQGNVLYLVATARNGVVENNTSLFGNGQTLTVKNLCDTTPDPSIRIGNNWTTVNGTNFTGYTSSYSNQNETTIAYSASMNIDSNTGAIFDITATNNTAFTINNPTNGTKGKRIWVKLRNTSGGALGAITWGGSTKVATASPANGFSRTWELTYDGTNWIQTGGAFADVPN